MASSPLVARTSHRLCGLRLFPGTEEGALSKAGAGRGARTGLGAWPPLGPSATQTHPCSIGPRQPDISGQGVHGYPETLMPWGLWHQLPPSCHAGGVGFPCPPLPDLNFYHFTTQVRGQGNAAQGTNRPGL